jgi:hypothetical protein
MMTKEEFIHKWEAPFCEEADGPGSFLKDLNAVIDHEIEDVSGSSLPFKIERIIVVVAQRWGNDYHGSTVGIIGREAIEICEKYGIDWKNYR